MKILGIETSCDETAVAIYDEKKGLIANVVSSQVELHKEWGGVYPELAAREHTKNILPVLDKALKDAKITLSEIDAVAITVAPGLIVSLVIGVAFAKALAFSIDKPLIPVHHIEAHIFGGIMDEKVEYPFLALIVSGGHTELYLIEEFEKYKFLGGTLDDAVGEAYDKVARMLDLGYPGGPIIDKMYKEKFTVVDFPTPLKGKKEHRFNFSFSGLKAEVLRTVNSKEFSKEEIASSFQKKAVEILVNKSIDASLQYNTKTIVVAGGVSANKLLRKELTKKAKNLGIDVVFPPFYLCTDNGAMVAYTGYKRFKLTGKTINYDFKPIARIRMDKFIELLYNKAP
jgi:N6-L-threonylcarbamoyladenine synthase